MGNIDILAHDYCEARISQLLNLLYIEKCLNCQTAFKCVQTLQNLS